MNIIMRGEKDSLTPYTRIDNNKYKVCKEIISVSCDIGEIQKNGGGVKFKSALLKKILK